MFNFASVARTLRRVLGRVGTAEPDIAVLAFGLVDQNGNIAALADPTSGSLKVQQPCVAASADGAVTAKQGYVMITKSASAAALTLASPVSGSQKSGGDDGKELTFVSTTAQAHTVTCTAGFGGGTTARDVATFGGAINDGFKIVAYGGVWYDQYTRNVTFG